MKSILFRRSPCVFTVLIILYALFIPSVSADTEVPGGTISTDTIWLEANSPYIITGNITVMGTDGTDGITTLTIEPGVIVKFNSSRYMNIGASSGDPGALSAVGTSAQPIVFTSNQASPSAGDWNYIRFYNTTDDATTAMEHCVVEYGGASTSYGALYAYQASPTFREVTVRNSKSYGAYIYSSEPVIVNCTFTGNQNYDLFYTGTVGGSVTGSIINSGISLLAAGTVGFSGNTINQNNAFPIKTYADNVGSIVSGSTINNVDANSYLEVSADTIEHDAVWTAALPYAITGNIIVKGADGADGITTLTIEPEAALKFNSSRYMSIGASSGDPGALSAVGTSAQPIVFTSNQASPSAGDWNYIRFYNTTDDATTAMEHCVVEYGGASTSYGALYAYQASPTFREVTVRSSRSYGAYIYSSEPVIENCTFTGNQNYDLFYTGTVGGSVTGSTINSGISLLATGTVSFSGNTINQNNDFPIKAYADIIGEISNSTFNNVDAGSYLEVYADTVERDATWTAVIPYSIAGNICVKGTDGDGITTLTIQPGAVLKFNSSRFMDIGAISGDPGALIAEGTADNQILFTSNQAEPNAGDWNFIRFLSTTDDETTVMNNCVVEYGGYSYGAVYLYEASPKIQNTTVRYSKNAGILAYGNGTDSAVIDCNTFAFNQYGIRWTADSPPEMHGNNFMGNTAYGIYYTGSETLNAENNWWGDIAGPDASGDALYGNIDADPWSTTENQCGSGSQNYPPIAPSEPSPADGAVHVEADSGLTLSWICQDPNDQDTLVYDLYWGQTSETLQLETSNLSDATFTKTDLSRGTTYFWQVIARDNSGLTTESPFWHFTTQGDPPDLVVTSFTTSPAGGMQANSTVVLTATVQNSGNGPVVDGFITEFRSDGNLIRAHTTDQIIPPGSTLQFECNWFYTGGDPVLSVVTDIEATVDETDENNNGIETILSTVADITPPTVVAHAPQGGAILQQIQQISITLSDTQSSIDDASVTASFTLTDASQQTFDVTVSEENDTFTLIPVALPLADGTYEIYAAAIDTHGNSQSYTFGFIIDTAPPDKPAITGGTIASGVIQPRPVLNEADRVIFILEGTREDNTSLWINHEKYAAIGSGDWSHTMKLDIGLNSFEIYCVDEAGNQSESEWVDIQLDALGGVVYEYDASGRLKSVTVKNTQQ